MTTHYLQAFEDFASKVGEECLYIKEENADDIEVQYALNSEHEFREHVHSHLSTDNKEIKEELFYPATEHLCPFESELNEYPKYEKEFVKDEQEKSTKEIHTCCDTFQMKLVRDSDSDERPKSSLASEYFETQKKKLHRCHICHKTFTQNVSLKAHARIHTGEKPYRCDICKHAFTQKQNLNRHIRTHTGEKPSCCDICDKKFCQSGDLKKHIRTHTGEKPYGCDICSKSFTTSTGLGLHIRTHTGEKPYACDICDRTFSRKNNMLFHLKNQHK